MLKRTKAAIEAPSGPIAQTFEPPKRLTWAEIKAIKGPVGAPSTDPKHQPKPRTGRSFSAGSTDLHRTRVRPLPTGHPGRELPRPDVLRRQLIRKLRAQGVTVVDEAKKAAA